MHFVMYTVQTRINIHLRAVAWSHSVAVALIMTGNEVLLFWRLFIFSFSFLQPKLQQMMMQAKMRSCARSVWTPLLTVSCLNVVTWLRAQRVANVWLNVQYVVVTCLVLCTHFVRNSCDLQTLLLSMLNIYVISMPFALTFYRYNNQVRKLGQRNIRIRNEFSSFVAFKTTLLLVCASRVIVRLTHLLFHWFANMKLIRVFSASVCWNSDYCVIILHALVSIMTNICQSRVMFTESGPYWMFFVLIFWVSTYDFCYCALFLSLLRLILCWNELHVCRRGACLNFVWMTAYRVWT